MSTDNSGRVYITATDGDDRVVIGPGSRPGNVRIAFYSNGFSQVVDRPRWYFSSINCDLGGGNDYYSNRTDISDRVYSYRDTIYCGDGDSTVWVSRQGRFSKIGS